MKNCIVAQSGGPTVAINASLAGVISGVMNSSEYDIVYGSLNGITGILNNRTLNLSEIFAEGKPMLDRLITTPAMYLGSCRYKLPTADADPAVYENIFRFFEEKEIAAFFYIGGNDSMDTVDKLSAYAEQIGSPVRIIGIPKTIDNDLCLTDHTPGFGSAAKYVASTFLEIAHDTYIYKIKSVTIVEVMGRDAGWLTAASALARNEYNAAPHLIYLPEYAFDLTQFLADVKDLLTKQDNIIVAVSEGIRDKDGKYISASSTAVDTFGHSQLSGAGKTLEYFLKEKLDVKVRSVELNVLQRCAAHIASKTDLEESFKLGETAVGLAAAGQTSVMLTMNRTSNNPYTIEYSSSPVCDIANKAKEVPRSFINEQGNDVTEDMIDYLRPLIQGELCISYENGLPCYLPIKHLLG
ncbi:MAG: 6-phosphofructokinase [Lachnospira sp.]|nr:6-phosphofructokinase [Lachnospira sp.]